VAQAFALYLDAVPTYSIRLFAAGLRWPFITERALLAARVYTPTEDLKIMVRKASAVWKGNLKEGKGLVSTESGVLSNAQYSFSTRFENGVGTNPEELIAAAHAGCFAMALSGQLGNAGLTAESLEVTAAVTLEKTDAGFTVTKSHLDLTARIPGASQTAFDTAANNAKAGCPISRLLKADISLSSKLVS